MAQIEQSAFVLKPLHYLQHRRATLRLCCVQLEVQKPRRSRPWGKAILMPSISTSRDDGACLRKSPRLRSRRREVPQGLQVCCDHAGVVPGVAAIVRVRQRRQQRRDRLLGRPPQPVPYPGKRSRNTLCPMAQVLAQIAGTCSSHKFLESNPKSKSNTSSEVLPDRSCTRASARAMPAVTVYNDEQEQLCGVSGMHIELYTNVSSMKCCTHLNNDIVSQVGEGGGLRGAARSANARRVVLQQQRQACSDNRLSSILAALSVEKW